MTEQIDLDFNQYIVPPSDTFEDTLRLHYGWSSVVRDEDGKPKPEASFIADIDGVDGQIEAMLRFVAAGYTHFGGGEGKLPFPVLQQAVVEYVGDWDNQSSFGVYGFEDEIIGLIHRYLCGEGDSYNRMNMLVEMHGF